jgi:hypothetical protein
MPTKTANLFFQLGQQADLLTEDEVLGKSGIYIREIVVCWFGWEA